MADALSPLVVASQLWIPFTALFAWRVLGEDMPRAAVAGLVIAFLGVGWMSLDPHGAGDFPAVLLVTLASACWAMATVLVRKTPGIKPLKLQGLTAVVAAPALLGLSALFETIAWLCVLFAGVVSTTGASALLFWLVQRREAGRVTPYFLLTPLVSCTIGVLFLGDRLSPQLLVGGGATMVGVALVALTEQRAKALESAAKTV